MSHFFSIFEQTTMETIQVSNYVILVVKVLAVITSVTYYISQYNEVGSGETASGM